MRNYGILGSALAAASIGAYDVAANLSALPSMSQGGLYRDRYKANRSSFDPKINRHTGKPHEHKREIARRSKRSAA